MTKEFDLIKPPHKKISEVVTDKDMERVIEDAQKMFKLCVDGCLAIAHCQIDDKNPLRFFCTADKIFINPVITRNTKSFVDSTEGCKWFPQRSPVIVQRHYRIEFDFQVVDMHKLSEIQHEKVKGVSSFVIQHEIDHMDGNCIYNF